MYQIYKAPDFDKYVRKILSKPELLELSRFIERLKINPYIGKPLGFSFFREHKFGGKRVYFLIYDDICLVLLVTSSDKKEQKAVIKKIKELFSKYEEYVQMLHSNSKL